MFEFDHPSVSNIRLQNTNEITFSTECNSLVELNKIKEIAYFGKTK